MTPEGVHAEGGDVDRAAFVALYEQQARRVAGVLVADGASASVAEEATAEAFARAWQRWSQVGGHDQPVAWVMRTALNEVRRRGRRAALERRLLGRRRLDPVEAAPHTPDDELWRAVRRLPTRSRQAVALRYVADLEEAEVARVMGVSRGSVATTLSRARRRLLAELEPSVTTGRSADDRHDGRRTAWTSLS